MYLVGYRLEIAALGVPILLRELSQIREAVNQKPKINIGLASVNDLPLSKVRNAKALHTAKDISRGYPHFELVVRNNGRVTAKSIKIHFEFVSRASKENHLAVPVLECTDWLKDDRFTFKKVNNADFVFIGGADWVLHANDSDMFPFHMTTTLGKKDGSVKDRIMVNMNLSVQFGLMGLINRFKKIDCKYS
jgi:hypothetical protein